MKKHLKHSNFSFFFNLLVCLFPTNIRNFRQKRPIFLKKSGKKVGIRQTSKNLENPQDENFCLTHFSKLNRDPIEKKVIGFWSPQLAKGRKLCLKFSRIRHDLSLGFDRNIYTATKCKIFLFPLNLTKTTFLTTRCRRQKHQIKRFKGQRILGIVHKLRSRWGGPPHEVDYVTTTVRGVALPHPPPT